VAALLCRGTKLLASVHEAFLQSLLR